MSRKDDKERMKELEARIKTRETDRKKENLYRTNDSDTVTDSKDDAEKSDKGKKQKNKNQKNNKKKTNIFDIIIPIVLLAVFLYSGYQLYSMMRTYQVAVNEYEDLAEQFIVEEPLAQAEAEVVEEYHDIPNLHIDFDGLRAINEDLVGWLYVPVLDISYPVLQGADNDYYLHYTYEGTPNNSGSIFLDSQSLASMEDRNTFIYGHNMKNGSMFGSMKKFRSDETLCASNPYVYYYTPERSYKYQIFAYYVTKVGSATYYNFYTDKQYDDYMKMVAQQNEYAEGGKVDLSEREPIITLSTCSGAHTNRRMVTHAVLIDSMDTSSK